jgi:hypothetical protein
MVKLVRCDLKSFLLITWRTLRLRDRLSGCVLMAHARAAPAGVHLPGYEDDRHLNLCNVPSGYSSVNSCIAGLLAVSREDAYGQPA